MLGSITEFEKKFKVLESQTADDLSDWQTHEHALYSVQPIETTAAGAIGSLACTNVGKLKLRTIRWQTAVQSTSLINDGCIYICAPWDGATEVRSGIDDRKIADGDHAYVMNRYVGTKILSSEFHSSVNIALPLELLEERARDYYGVDHPEPLQFYNLTTKNKDQVRAIRNLFSHFLVHAVNVPTPFEDNLIESSFEELVMSTVLNALPHNYSLLGARQNDKISSRSVRRALEYMTAHADEQISLRDVAEFADCSQRSLQRSFQEYYNDAPMVAFRDIKLERAKEDLSSGIGTVTEIAHKWGFSNPGRFATLYSKKFGEKPSETIKGYRSKS